MFGWIQRREVWPGIILDAPATVIWKYREGMRYGMWDAIASPELVIPTKYYGGDEWVEITGSRGVIWVNRCSGEMLDAPAVVLYRDGETRAFEDLETDWGVSFVRQGQDFVAAIREGRPCTLTGPEARRVLQFNLAVHRLGRGGAPGAGGRDRGLEPVGPQGEVRPARRLGERLLLRRRTRPPA